MRHKEHWFWRFFVFVFFGFMLVNLMFLNYIVLKEKQTVGSMQVVGALNKNVNGDLCDTKTCVPELYDAIYQATASQQLQKSVASQTVSGAEEYYITLGTGTVTSNTWVDVGGASAYIDSSKYENIQTVTFEASVVIPTGNQTAYVQLYNATAQHPVWFSQVSLQGGQPQLLISQPITLDPGSNLYQVQMMTQLQYPAVLTQSRVHIITSN
jgi:hypothetical protein